MHCQCELLFVIDSAFFVEELIYSVEQYDIFTAFLIVAKYKFAVIITHE